MKILILGANGFIGHHLITRILATTDWEVIGIDVEMNRVEALLPTPRFRFLRGDITSERAWVESSVQECDVILPLVAIATPARYIEDPLSVFELAFAANLPIVRHAVEYRKRLVFPSSSEVYGMCEDAEFDPEVSSLVYGPISKPRWIYACSKQLMDRIIAANGQQRGLDYTLFRPFNWIGPGQDSVDASKEGSSRVVTQFFGHIIRGESLTLVDGGRQRRAFTDIDDGIDALMRIIDNHGGVASGKIYNLGNPNNDLSVRELAAMMLELAAQYPEYRDAARRVRVGETPSAQYYGAGYQDIQRRVPSIRNVTGDLGWSPRCTVVEALRKIYDAHLAASSAVRPRV
jgi:nucleoside-diphosphate-sugar epimerase